MKIADDDRLPVLLVKAAAGGGGRGMKVARRARKLSVAILTAKRKPRPPSATTPSISEKYLEKPRHIEVQILGDGHGGAIHLANATVRCSAVTRRCWRKPPPALNEAQRAEIGESAPNAMRELNIPARARSSSLRGRRSSISSR